MENDGQCAKTPEKLKENSNFNTVEERMQKEIETKEKEEILIFI